MNLPFFKGRKRHTWFWYAFWALMSAAFTYLMARMFLRAVLKQLGNNDTNGRKKVRMDKKRATALFV